MQKHIADRLSTAKKDDLTKTGYAIVQEQVKRAANDVQLCQNLGKILDTRRDAILALVKLVEELLDE